jgi:hypothetical protein
MERRQATIAAVDAGFLAARIIRRPGRPMMVLPFATSRAAAFVGFYDWYEAPRPTAQGRKRQFDF